MQVVKRSVKTTFLIFLITVIYGVFNKAELPLLFCVCYAAHSGSIIETTVVSMAMGIISCAFGKYGFLQGMLLCLYGSYIFLLFKPRKNPFIKKTALFCIFAGLVLGRDFVYSSLFFVPLYFLTCKIYKEKEKYIFS